MNKPNGFSSGKHHFDVYYVGKGEGCYAKEYCREYIGSTYATSAAQACSNVRYRNRTKEQPNGGYSHEILGDSMDMGFVIFSYEAVQTD